MIAETDFEFRRNSFASAGKGGGKPNLGEYLDGVIVSGTMRDRRSSRTFQASIDDSIETGGHSPGTLLSPPDAEAGNHGSAGRRRLKKRLSIPRMGSKVLSRLPSIRSGRRGSFIGGGGKTKKGANAADIDIVGESDESPAQPEHDGPISSNAGGNKPLPQSALFDNDVEVVSPLNDTPRNDALNNDGNNESKANKDDSESGSGSRPMSAKQRREQFRRGSFSQTSEASLSGSFALRTGTASRPQRRRSSSSARRLGEKTQSNSSLLSLHSLGAASGASASSAGHNSAHPFYKQHESTGSLLDLTPDDLQDPYCPTIKDDVYERSRRIHRRNSYENRRSSERRTSIDLSALRKVDSFHNLVRNERWMDWASSVRRLDPRYQILTYFDDVARDGGILSGIGANRASVLSRLSTTSSNRGSRGSHQMMTSLIDLDGLDGSCRSQARSVISVASSGDGASYAAASIHSAAAQRYNDSGRDEDLDVVARSVARHFAGGAWTTVAKRITLGPSSGSSSPSPGAGSGGKGGFRRSFRRLSSGLTAGSRRGSMTSVIEDTPEGTGDGSSNSDAYGNNNSSADFRRGSLRRLSSGNFGRRKSATAAALAAAAGYSADANAASGANSDSSGSRLAARLGASAGSMVSSNNSSSVNDYSSGDLSWQVQQLHGSAQAPQSPLHQHQQPAPPKKTSRRFRRRSSHSSRSGVRRFRRMRRRASAVLHPELQSPLLRLFNRAGVFTVWRPCSRDAIRAMMTGAATGKGLDVKGKSAKRGDLSGYVPFVQIHEEGHKQRVSSIPLEARTRVFYSSESDQEIVRTYLEEFVARHGAAYRAKYEEEHGGYVPEEMWWTSWVAVDDYASEGCWGIEMSQSLFWEALVASRPIERAEGSRLFTGRPSEPAFQDMNLQTVRLKEARSKAKDGNDGDGEKGEGGKSGQSQQQQQGGPIAVVWQASNMKPSVEVSPDQDGNVEAHRSGDPLDPRTFLVAYEEKGRVLPVVSDFDCFIMGTRGVQYDYPLPEEQVDLIQWCVSKVEGILDDTAAAAARKAESGGTNNGSGSSGGWTSQWLDVLKTEATKSALTGHKTAASSIQVPPYGFGDPTSYTIMEHAVRRLKCGAVRHGAECFNYKFPQEIDDNFLVISDTLPGNVPWKYVSEPELRRLLCQKVNEGFAFPINPKWVLCDPGWKVVYDRLLSSPNENIRKSMDVWFPPDSGLRERIEEVSRRHPRGFVAPPAPPPPRSSSLTAAGPGERRSSSRAGEREEEACGTEAMDLAELQLRRYLILQRAKRKLRTVLLFRRLGMEARERARQTDGETTETTKKTTMLQETTGPEEEDNDNDNNDNEGNIDGNGNGNSNGNGDGNDKKKKDGTTSDGNENDSHGTERGESPSPTLPPVSAAKSLVVGPMID